MDLEEETPIVETKPFGETSIELGTKLHLKLDLKTYCLSYPSIS